MKLKDKINNKITKLVCGEYYNLNYNRIRPEDRDAVVKRALWAGLGRVIGGLVVAIICIILIFVLITKMPFN